MALLRRVWDRVPGAARIGVVAAVAAAVAVGAPAGTADAAGGAGHVRANALGELDCNGFSPIQKSVKPTLVCADLRTSRTERFEDHGHYIGHDEPSLRFLSSRPARQRRDLGRAAPGRAAPAPDRASSRAGRDPQLRAHHRAVVLDEPVRSEVGSRTALQAAVGYERRPRLVPGRRLRVHGVAVLSAGVRAVRRLDQLRQHPLVLGAHH